MRKLLLLIAIAVLLSGAVALFVHSNSDDQIEKATAGLDPVTVAEALGHPSVIEDLKNYEEPKRSSAVQAFTRRITWCRATLVTFETWQATGKEQSIAAWPEPTFPAEPFYSGLKSVHSEFLADVKKNGIHAVRDELSLQGVCSEIPAEVNNPSGPTINDLMGGKR